MAEFIWTQMAQTHLQKIFSDSEDRCAGSGTELALALDEDLERLKRFPESAGHWRGDFRRLVFRERLGVFYRLHGERIVICGLFPLTMDPDRIFRRLKGEDWP